MPRYAAIDIGTNTVLLCVADHDGTRLHPVLGRSIIARLGQGLDASGTLRADAIARAMEALGSHLAESRAAGALKTAVVGTAALREARNADRFVAEARRRFDIDVQVISGDEEARLAFLAVARDREERGDESPGSPVVMDIGGGSTEFIIGRGATVETLHTLPIGSVRLTERFLARDPVRPEEGEALRTHIKKILAALPVPSGEPLELTGVAGTNTTLAAMKEKIRAYDAAAIRRVRLSVADLDEQIRTLEALDIAERRKLPGLDPGRADVILAGAMIAREGLARFGVSAMAISDRGVRHGVIYRLAETGKP